MEVRVARIEEKVKKWDLDFARVSDFRCRPDSTVDAQTIVERPDITLYCLDDDRREAVFVESPEGVDVTKRPFLFLAQYENAQRTLTVSYETLHELAAARGDRFQRLIPMHSVGRCGGTLVSRAFDRLGTVLSLDEPDVYNQIGALRPQNGSRDAELTKLVHSCTRLMFKPIHREVDTLFLKFRPSCIKIADLVYNAYPAGRTMFLYRNAETWARSAGRSIQKLMETLPHTESTAEDPYLELLSRLDISKPVDLSARAPAPAARRGRQTKSDAAKFNEHMSPLVRNYIKRAVLKQLTPRDKLTVLWLAVAQRIPVLNGHCSTPLDYLLPYVQRIPPMKFLALSWISPMQQYLAWHAQGIRMLAVQYETLVSAPLPALQAIFEYCGLPVAEAAVAEGAFAEDSQKNTPLSRDTVRAAHGALAPELLAQLHEILREHPPTNTPDFVVPNSLVLRPAEPAAVSAPQ